MINELIDKLNEEDFEFEDIETSAPKSPSELAEEVEKDTNILYNALVHYLLDMTQTIMDEGINSGPLFQYIEENLEVDISFFQRLENDREKWNKIFASLCHAIKDELELMVEY